MKVYVFPSDAEGCGYYRLIWASMVLKSQGHDVHILHPSRRGRITGETNDAGQLIRVSVPRDADVLVFQRVTSKVMLQAIPAWRQRGIAVVVDIDDDLSAIDPRNPAWVALHPTSTGETAQYDWHAAQKFCEAATFVTTSTESLLRKYAHPRRKGDPVRGAVLYNCVPEATTRITHSETHNLIGWGGNVSTHPDDPPVVGVALARLQRDGYDFRIIGPSYRAKAAFKLDREPNVTGGIHLSRWHHELAKLSVGIAPLTNTKFNHAKSWLKMLEYAAVGVPCVGSPLTEYRRLHEMGVGLLAESPRDWYRHVRRLLGDDQLRQDMSVHARTIVAEKLTIEANAWRWWEAWQTALRIQRGSSTSPFVRPTVDTAGRDGRGPQTS